MTKIFQDFTIYGSFFVSCVKRFVRKKFKFQKISLTKFMRNTKSANKFGSQIKCYLFRISFEPLILWCK